MTDLRVGLVGCGRLAEVGYVPALRDATGVALAAVADPDPGRRAAVAALAGGVPTFPDATALLDAGGVDAVVLATPVDAHLADASAAAAAGIPSLVEKPPAPDSAGARALAGLAPAPAIAFNRRFEPGPERLREATPQGAEVLVDLRISYRRGGWGAHAVADDALLDLGPHLVDLARWITGAEVTRVRRADLAQDRAAVDLDLGPSRARIRCATDRPHLETFTVRRRDGQVLAAHRTGGLLRAVTARLRPGGGPHPLVASLTAQVAAFGCRCRGEPEPILGCAADGVAVMCVLDAARASAAAGTPIPLPQEGP